jgi:membrane protease YdiL (CAAX protease family)
MAIRAETTAKGGVTHEVRSWVQAHQLGAFFWLALGITWAAFIPWYLSGGEGIPWFTFGPVTAAFAVAAVGGGWSALKAVLASMVKWRVSPLWYAVAIGLPVAAQVLSILLNPLFGSAGPAWTSIPPGAEILPMVVLYAVFSGPLGEEPGWRGFALPVLLRQHSAASASVVLGLFWTLWHLPLAFVGDLSVYGSITTVLAAFVFTWVYQNTNGSVLIAILMHVAHQNSVRYLGKVFVEGDHVQQQWIGTALWAAMVLGILAVYGTASFARRPSSLRSGVLAADGGR